jgi:hypothetical protein
MPSHLILPSIALRMHGRSRLEELTWIFGDPSSLVEQANKNIYRHDLTDKLLVLFFLRNWVSNLNELIDMLSV